MCSSTRPTALVFSLFFFLMIRRPPRSTLDRSSAASDVYKRQAVRRVVRTGRRRGDGPNSWPPPPAAGLQTRTRPGRPPSSLESQTHQRRARCRRRRARPSCPSVGRQGLDRSMGGSAAQRRLTLAQDIRGAPWQRCPSCRRRCCCAAAQGRPCSSRPISLEALGR